MANRNGLISSKDVSATGAANSNFFLRKGQAIAAPTFISPVSVVSEDGTKTGTIAQNNNGNLVVIPDTAGHLYLFGGEVYFSSSDGTKSGSITETNIGQMVIASGVGDLSLQPGTGSVYILSPDTNTSARMAVSNGGPFTITCGGNDTVVIGGNTASAGAVLQVNGSSGVGRVYDTLYNTLPAAPPVATVSDVYTSPGVPVSTNALIGSGTLSAGLYILQAKVLVIGTLTAGTSINCYVEDFPPSPNTYVPYSSLVLTPGMLASPTAPDTNMDATFSSAVFTVPAGLTHWNYFVEVNGAWNFGAGGTLALQLVKLG